MEPRNLQVTGAHQFNQMRARRLNRFTVIAATEPQLVDSTHEETFIQPFYVVHHQVRLQGRIHPFWFGLRGIHDRFQLNRNAGHEAFLQGVAIALANLSLDLVALVQPPAHG